MKFKKKIQIDCEKSRNLCKMEKSIGYPIIYWKVVLPIC